MSFVDDFTVDILKLSETDLFKKYDNKIPHGTKIRDVVEKVNKSGNASLLIDDEIASENQDITFNLYKSESSFIVLQREQGGDHWVKKHTSLDAALFDKIDRIFNAMMYPAPDSIINKKYSSSSYPAEMTSPSK